MCISFVDKFFRCTSPELSKLGLSGAVSCPSGGGLGMWEVFTSSSGQTVKCPSFSPGVLCL